MRYKTICPITFMGDRVEAGGLVETTPEDAARYGGDLVPADPVTVETPDEEPEPVPVDQMTVVQLKDRAKELGLSTSGSKADLVERIKLQGDGAGEAPTEEDN